MSSESSCSSDDEDLVVSKLLCYDKDLATVTKRTASVNHSLASPQNTSISQHDAIIEIPGVFLTQGERNRKLLQQTRELALELEKEKEKSRAKQQAFENLRTSILEELNDNGTSFVYSWKNNEEIVKKYMRDPYQTRSSLLDLRHFYYFGAPNTSRVDLARASSFARSFRLSGPILSEPLLLLKRINASNYNLTDVVCSCVVVINDETVLRSIERLFTFIHSCLTKIAGYDHLPFSGLGLPVLRAVAKINETEVSQSMSAFIMALGGFSLSGEEPIQATLKLMHYNSYTKQILIRLCIVFHYFILRISTKKEFMLLVAYFFVASSDFFINKREKDAMRKSFTGPIFETLIDWWASRYELPSLGISIHGVFSSARTCSYGDSTFSKQKSLELHFNMLMNLLCSVSKESSAFEIVNELVMRFCDANAPYVADLNQLTEVTANLGKLDWNNGDRNDIYKNFYKAMLVTLYIHSVINREPLSNKQGLFVYHKRLLSCKSIYQMAIGELSYATNIDSTEKGRLSAFLSDTYHLMDYLVALFDKSNLFLERDFFYDELDSSYKA